MLWRFSVFDFCTSVISLQSGQFFGLQRSHQSSKAHKLCRSRKEKRKYLTSGCWQVTHPSVVNSEFLCFLTDRCWILAVNDIVKICADFYSEDEILAIRQLSDRLGLGHPLIRCKGPEKLPRVDITHCDISLLLAEIQSTKLAILWFTEKSQSSQAHRTQARFKSCAAGSVSLVNMRQQ